MANPVENTTYCDISGAGDEAAGWATRGLHHIGWPDNESRTAAVGWLADMVAVPDVGDGRAGVPYHDACGTVLPFVTIDNDARGELFAMGYVTEAAWGRSPRSRPTR